MDCTPNLEHRIPTIQSLFRQSLIWIVLLWTSLPALVRADKFDDSVKAQMQWQHIPGLSVMVSRNGQLIRAKGYGMANLEDNIPATAETAYKIASISKQFMAAGMLTLVQVGKVRLDDSVDLYIADVPESWKKNHHPPLVIPHLGPRQRFSTI
jgi:CubicO group peptidase (beta-lactamase class C family)